MALRMGALYDALLAGNVPPDQARKAAEEVAAYDHNVADMKNEITAMRGEITTMKWTLGTNLALTLGVLGRLLFVK